MRLHLLILAAAISFAAPTASAGGNPPGVSSKRDTAIEFERRKERNKPFDCHRDIRRHRINGIMILHRHVGDRCQVRVVRQGT